LGRGTFFGEFFRSTDDLSRAQKPWTSIFLLVLEYFTTTCLP
jgi:hypothetical protein